MNGGAALLIAFVLVCLFRTVAFRGTNSGACSLDLILLAVLTVLLSGC